MHNIPYYKLFWVNKVFFSFSQNVDYRDRYVGKSIIHINFAARLKVSLPLAALIFFIIRIRDAFSKNSKYIFSNITVECRNLVLSKLFLPVSNMSICDSIIEKIIRSIAQSWAYCFYSYFMFIPLKDFFQLFWICFDWLLLTNYLYFFLFSWTNHLKL